MNKLKQQNRGIKIEHSKGTSSFVECKYNQYSMDSVNDTIKKLKKNKYYSRCDFYIHEISIYKL